MQTSNYTRGSIWWVRLPKLIDTSLQGGFRPVVIISSDHGCNSSDVLNVCPLTTKIKNLSVNILIKPIVDERPTQVLTNQVMSVSKSWFNGYIGCLSPEEMSKVDQGVILSLGLETSLLKKVKPEGDTKNSDKLDELVLQAKELIKKLNNAISLVSPGETGNKSRRYSRRTEDEIQDFIKEWEYPGNNRKEVAEAFGFSTYGAAYNFWVNHRSKE